MHECAPLSGIQALGANTVNRRFGIPLGSTGQIDLATIQRQCAGRFKSNTDIGAGYDRHFSSQIAPIDHLQGCGIR